MPSSDLDSVESMSPNRLYREQVHSRHLVTAPQLPNSFLSSGVALLRPGILSKPSNFRGLHAYKRLRVLSMFLVHPGAPDQATDVWLWKSDKNAETMFTRPLQEFAQLYEHNALAGRSLQAAFPPFCFWCPTSSHCRWAGRIRSFVWLLVR